MPGINNFLEWNPTGANQENDATYAADAQRLAGATSPSLWAAVLANKVLFQHGRMATALAQMMANKNYNMSDANLANLIAALANIVTNADVPTILNNTILTGDPHAPTPPVGDNDVSVATTAFVKAVLGAAGGFVLVPGINGYIKFPSALGGLIIQWVRGTFRSGGAGEGADSSNFVISFPTACFGVQVTMDNNGYSGNANDCWYQVVSFNNNGVTTFRQGTGGTNQDTYPRILAIGN